MTTIPYYLFEDPGWRRFGPVTSLRPVWDLRIGLETLGNRIARRLDREPTGFLPRPALVPLVSEQHGPNNVGVLPNKGDIYLVNGRIAGTVPEEGLDPKCPWSVWTDGPDVVAARLPAVVARKWFAKPVQDPKDFSIRALLAIWSQEHTAPEVRIYELNGALTWWPWNLLKRQKTVIANTLRRVGDGSINGDVHHRAVLIEETNMHIATGAKVAGGAILDATEGPIILEDGVRVMPGAVIIGPAVIGVGSLVKAGAKLYGPITAGPVCKLGGEIEECIFLGYSNKQHEGFLGHSIVGEWVNLGADTNNSDLKNNYSNVSVTIEGESINTGETFFGSIIGDHVKTAINTQLNTGTVIGVGTNIYGAGFPPKTVGAFRWGGADGFEYYEFDKFLATAKTVAGRRDKELTPAMITLLRKLHQEAVQGHA